MKPYFIKSIFFVLAGLSLTLSGCLKDDAFDDGAIQSTHANDGVPKVIEIKLTATDASNLLVLAVNNSNTDTTMDLVPINLATANAAPEDIHVKVALDSGIVKAYNAAHADDPVPPPVYEVPPASMFTIVDSEVVIPKGSHTGYVQVKFKASDFLGGDWAVGFKVAGIQEEGYTISGNMGTGMTVLTVKNEWDGDYVLGGVIGGVNAYTGTKLSGTLTLTTVNTNTIAEGTSIVNFFGGYTEYSFNDNGTVGVKVLDEAGGGSLGAVVQSSSYDPETHNFKVKFAFLNGKYIMDATFTRK